MSDDDALEEVVRRYLADHADHAERELRFYRIQRTLQEAVALAGLAKLPSGKRHPHQRRIPARVLQEGKDRLMQADLARCSSFGELHATIESSIGRVRGIGDLTVYDTSLRIGAKLGLEPEVVYLHAGARLGARSLGLSVRRSFLEPSDLPETFRRLKPYQIEDCLCIFKKELGQIGRLLGRANPPPRKA